MGQNSSGLGISTVTSKKVDPCHLAHPTQRASIGDPTLAQIGVMKAICIRQAKGCSIPIDKKPVGASGT